MAAQNILPGVPSMWYGNPSAVCFVGSVMRLLAYIGDPASQDEVFALSGAGLCFPWRFDSACDEVGIIPEIPARTFEAFGYASEYLRGEAIRDKAACLDKIKRSIDGGRPAIGFGITQKQPMACLVVGYDENGLYTRSFWPPVGVKHDAEAYFYTPDWHENCAGLLIVGAKTGERLTDAAAYGRIIEWARNFRWERVPRGYDNPVMSEGKQIFLNQHAFDAMAEWLLDDAQWQDLDQYEKNEQYMKQCGLLLFAHYRDHLRAYLKKLDAQYPGVVNQPVFTALERIGAAIPGASASDLWLHEAVDPALSDFSAMRERAMREKAARYVRMLKGYDNSVQWTLFMPDFVKRQQKGFQVETFAYREFPAMRFIGAEGEEYADVGRRLALMRALDAMEAYKSGFDCDLFFMHHCGLEANNPWHGVWGRFMKAGAPVPEGCLSVDFVPFDVPAAGPPYYSRFAHATFSGDTEKLHAREGYDSDAMYDVTRNTILGDDVAIPYPEKYWTAEVFPDGCDKPGTGYLFSIGEWDTL